MNNNKKIIILTITIIAIGLIAASATFAWFLWFSSDAEKTNVTFTVPNGANQLKVILDADSTEFTDMYPTSGCDKTGAKMATITVYTENQTSTSALVDATLTLDSVVAGAGGGTPDRSAIHYALSTNSKATCSSGIFAEGTLAGKSNGDAIYNGDLTVHKINKNSSLSSKTIYLYVWIDENYEFYNTGNSIVNDPMQNMKVKFVWSGTVTNTMPDVTGGVYTFTNTHLILGEAIPEGVDTYDNHTDAEIAGGGIDYGLFAKSTVVNDLLTEHYMGFRIPELAETDNPELTAGVYEIRLLVSSGPSYRTIFLNNVATLKRAFGEENCTMREDNNQYQCQYSGGDGYYGLSVWVNVWGSGATWTGGYRHCESILSDQSVACYTTS